MRGRSVAEVVMCMKAVKIYTWEEWAYARVQTLRAAELKQQAACQYLRAFSNFQGLVAYVVVATAAFAYYICVLGHDLDSTTAFTSLAWIDLLQVPVRRVGGVPSTAGMQWRGG